MRTENRRSTRTVCRRARQYARRGRCSTGWRPAEAELSMTGAGRGEAGKSKPQRPGSTETANGGAPAGESYGLAAGGPMHPGVRHAYPGFAREGMPRAELSAFSHRLSARRCMETHAPIGAVKRWEAGRCVSGSWRPPPPEGGGPPGHGAVSFQPSALSKSVASRCTLPLPRLAGQWQPASHMLTRA